MARLDRIGAEFVAGWHAFVRRRTAVFFTFFFPLILVVIFAGLVRTSPGGGLFTEPPAYYVPGYLAVVVLFTPLSRLSSTVARSREAHRFEKLATTPLTKPEWLFAHTLVNAALVGLAGLLVVGLVVALTDPVLAFSPIVGVFVALGVVLFCGIGAVLGRLADSQDGAIAAANAVGLPLVFLSETFVPPALLPAWFRVVVDLSPLTYFARGVRSASQVSPAGGPDPWFELFVLGSLAVVSFGLGVHALPWRT